MDANTIMIMGMFITIIIGLAAILKFLFSLNNRITNLEIEIGKLSMRVERLEIKFDIVKNDGKNINEKIDKVEVLANKRIDKVENKIEENNNNLINKALETINNIVQKPVL